MFSRNISWCLCKRFCGIDSCSWEFFYIIFLTLNKCLECFHICKHRIVRYSRCSYYVICKSAHCSCIDFSCPSWRCPIIPKCAIRILNIWNPCWLKWLNDLLLRFEVTISNLFSCLERVLLIIIDCLCITWDVFSCFLYCSFDIIFGFI